MKPANIILEGITGSTAYGLNTKNSDVDIKGVYLLPTSKVLSLRFNPQKTTKDHTDPDWVYHEVGKFMRLVISGNPTVTELLYLDEYTHIDRIGQMLVDNRDLFLSTGAVMGAYRGYAKSQALRLNNRTEQGLDGYASSLKNRFAKHTRHCFRLLLQAEELLTTGTLHVKVTPEQREWLFEMGEQPVETVVDKFLEMDEKFNTMASVLPDEPEWDKLDELLLQIRSENLMEEIVGG
jgi:predicted nucleotidyltransferase